MPSYSIAGVNVSFPFDAYDCQLVYMEKVILALQQGQNALLESPTGTGKTLCLLCATLAWRESLEPSLKVSQNTHSQMPLELSQESRKPRLPTIVYSSRTHSQLQQVIRELKSTVYRPKMVVLGSREQMCIHSEVKQLRGRGQNQACRSLCKSRSCQHLNRVAGYINAHPDLGVEPIDIEDLLSIGRTQGPCPYYLSRELHNSADIIFAPYNYLIEKENRRSLTGLHWENAVLIFDEAHNLENICADAASFDLSAAHLAACIAEAKQCVDLALAHRSRDNSADTSVDPENFAILKALLLELDKRINDVPFTVEGSGFTRPGPYIYEFLAEMKITQETVTMLLDTIDHATNLLEDEANMESLKVHKRSGNGHRLQALRDALRQIFQGADKSHATCYRFHIHEPYSQDTDKGARKGPKSHRVLSWWCFNPGLAMKEFSKLDVRSVILTSGTLAPLDSFAFELKLPFEVRLENPHVIGADQIWVGVLTSGPSGRTLNSSYRTRDSMEYKIELGNTIVNFARIVPDGLLVFFPSYYLLNQCIEAWQTLTAGAANVSTVWERICKHKQPVVEPRESSLFNHANEDFITKLNDVTSSGAVFFAVCRGKVSEGLDFADKAGRAVVITGIPFAMKTDPKVRLKREYLNEQSRLQTSKRKTLTGEEWYVQQASRAVNQAVGRVIRHRHDYGAIILCDERFSQGNAQNQMSLWLRPHLKSYAKFGDAAFTLTRFFRNKASTESLSNRMANHLNKENIKQQYSDMSIDLSCGDKTSTTFYSNVEGQRLPPTHIAENASGVAFLSQKLTIPSSICTGSCPNGFSRDPQKSLSALLANSRGSSATKRQLSTVTVTPANHVVGSNEGTIHMVSASRLSNATKHEGGHINGEISENDVIDLASPSSTKQGCASRQSTFESTQSTKKDRVDQLPMMSAVGSHAEKTESYNTQNSQANKSEGSSRKRNPSTKDDKKDKNAADFLKEVKARLSVPEYRSFVECMKGLRQQALSMTTVLETVASLFSAPERIYLLHRFREFVPTQHQELYERCLVAKCAVVDDLSGRQLPGDSSQKSPELHGFPSRSRKKLAVPGPSQPRTGEFQD